jgi:hypothetical protein
MIRDAVLSPAGGEHNRQEQAANANSGRRLLSHRCILQTFSLLCPANPQFSLPDFFAVILMIASALG